MPMRRPSLWFGPEPFQSLDHCDLEGIEGIEPKRAIEIMPYVLSRLDYSETVSASDPFRSTTEGEMTAGLDLKLGLTPNLTLTGTINPDFGQVEVDPAEVNLSQFELFYPEKRPFFIEGASLFEFGRGGSNNNFNINNFPPILFYSRRIGRSPQGLGGIDYDHLDAPAAPRPRRDRDRPVRMRVDEVDRRPELAPGRLEGGAPPADRLCAEL